MKNAKQLERVFKGVANHNRIEILFLIHNNKSKQMGLNDISEKLNKNSKTLSEHTHRLVKAGLVNKNYQGREVLHSLSPYGEKIISILKEF